MKQNNQQGCYHCPGGLGLKYPLFDDEYFWIVCDVHPLTEGHILIITKEHISCMGALSEDSFARFKELYKRILAFLNETYGQAGIFEHGVTGETVFHAHTHFLPFSKSIKEIIPEKESESIQKILTLDEMRRKFNKNHRYLYVAINNEKWLVDSKTGYPGFFRDRFAKALGTKERGDWKNARKNAELMKAFEKDIQKLKDKWRLEA